ncbi:uncharacterized protein [Lepeophtheirus salmonis]|uniref:uncharacterized protein n=1 Tax=Lepeophtheirus salmonis TaxID=72036 RepID=UPI001AE3A37A|nr:uncharacterized protein LOC121117342 [Lepeophtheirus salmonis]
MNELDFRKEVKDWLTSSGKLQEFQSRLRTDLIEAIAGKNLRKKKKNIKESTFDQSVNSLIIEYLMIHSYWYSASVLVSEANFLVQPPDIEIVQKLGSETKRHTPSRISEEDINNILKFLNLDPSIFNSIRTTYLNDSQESLLSATLINLKKPITFKPQSKESRNEKVLIERLSRLLNKGESLLDTTTDEDTDVDGPNRLEYLNKISEQNNTILHLNSQLREAKRKIATHEQGQIEVQRLEDIIEKQKYEILKLKQQRSSSKSIIPEKRQCADLEISEYLERIKLKTLHLSTEGQSIDQEFSRLTKSQILS